MIDLNYHSTMCKIVALPIKLIPLIYNIIQLIII